MGNKYQDRIPAEGKGRQEAMGQRLPLTAEKPMEPYVSQIEPLDPKKYHMMKKIKPINLGKRKNRQVADEEGMTDFINRNKKPAGPEY